MKSGLFWTALDKYSNFFISLAISMVLARLLTPYEFGVVTTASVLLAFLTIFTSVGIAPAIIQRKDLSDDEIDHIFTFTIILGLVIGAISFASSWIIADFYENALLRPVVQILSIGLFLSSLNIVPAALMSKNFRFKQMATRSIVFNLLFGLIGVISAFYGAGVYALVCPQIFASICTFFYNRHFYPVRIKFRFSIAPVKKIFSYSFYVFLTSFGDYLGRNLDKLVIGKSISADALGYYDKSYRLMQYPMTYISSVITPVLQPILSTLQNDMREMAEKYTRIVAFVASLSFPIAVILFFSAEDIIIVMFGDTWLPSVPAFKILTVSVPIMLISNLNGAVYLSCNASKEMFYLTLIGKPFFILIYCYAIFWGKSVESFAWAYVLNELFGTCVSYYVLYNRVMHTSVINVLRAIMFPFMGSILLIIVYYVAVNFLPNFWNHFIQLSIKFAFGGMFIIIYLKLTGQFDAFAYIKKLKLK